MEIKPTLEINFYSFYEPNIIYYKLPFTNKTKIEQNNKVIITIPLEYFEYGKDKKFTNIKLLDKDSKEINNTNFFLYYGENISYVNTYETGSNFELIFFNFDELSIAFNNIKFDRLDTFGNKDRKRLTLINYIYSTININNESVKLYDVISENYDGNSSNSYQISIKNLEEEKIYIVKNIEDFRKINYKYLEKTKEDLEYFNKDFYNMLKYNDKKAFKQQYNIISNQYKGINLRKIKESFFMNRPRICIEHSFNNNLTFDTFWNALLFIFFKENYLAIVNDYNLIKKFINKATMIKIKIEKEKIDIFEKVYIVKQLFLIFEECKFPEDLDVLKFRYFILSKKEKNSILDKVDSFFKDFINYLTEESQVFFYLLSVDSGCGYYKKQLVYTFDMSNIQMIKEHLTNFFPEILIFYYLKNDKAFSFTDSDNGTISFNEYLLLKFFNNIKINDYNVDQNDSIAFNLVLFLLHEYTGHKKFLFGENSNLSPKKYINDYNEIIELKYIGDFFTNDKSSEYILSSKCRNKGDSGNYIELCYGKYNGSLILDILNEFNDNAKLINRADLFTSSSCDILKQYTILKSRYKAIKNKNQTITKSMSIEEEIEEMKKKVKYDPNYKDYHLLKKKKKKK